MFGSDVGNSDSAAQNDGGSNQETVYELGGCLTKQNELVNCNKPENN
jgi:hypothetical protein